MTREIKFRVWDKVIEHMRYGYFPVKVDDYYKIWSFHSKSGGFFSKSEDQFELMQYTGIKDSKGRDIYEGDIIKDKRENIHQIRFIDGFASFRAFYSNTGDNCALNQDWINTFEKIVIGNIYDNPELVKK